MMAHTMSLQATDPPIYLAAYDPHWPEVFEVEKKLILDAIGEWIVAIEHVGSTSIPGIAAKPVIDICVGVRSIGEAYKTIFPLSELGYRCMGEAGIPERLYFKKPDDSKSLRIPGAVPRTHQIHMYETSNPEWQRHLAFRDYLRGHGEAREEYEALKRRLATEYGNDIEAYADAKSEFVERILRLAGAPGRPHPPAPSPVRGRGGDDDG
jgi:GrpB-like predicted nucleotidyltransferase (UPF0157 family)